MEHLQFCQSCKKYTLKTECPTCGKPTILPRPPKFTLNDKYAFYRRQIKKEEQENLAKNAQLSLVSKVYFINN